MKINIQLNKNFTTQYNKLQAEYGTEIAALNGFADEQLSYTYDKKKSDSVVVSDYTRVIDDTSWENVIANEKNNTYIYFTASDKIIFIPNDHDRTLGSTGGEGNNPTGHHGALNQPFDLKTGYCGDTISNLFHKTIISLIF